MWPYRWIIPFGGLNTASINTIGYQTSVFEYISWFFFYIVGTDNFVEGDWELRFGDMKAYKEISGLF